MSFLTEYFDEYRPHPLIKSKQCRPENRFAELEGKWLKPTLGSDREKQLSDEEMRAFIRETTRELRGLSTYYNDYCAHLPEELKTKEFVPKPKKKRPCPPCPDESTEAPSPPAQTEAPPVKPLALKDTHVMTTAGAMYGRDVNAPTLKPLDTHFRILGYMRPKLLQTGLSEYTDTIARLAYELVRDDRIPQSRPSNGQRPRWGVGEHRQPMLDIVPYEQERLF
ncbi:uncharacterized protein LOC105381382 [Plutella xylostella]|uniref:uncharacterized protein LOC105381382 n=1 Tax=Plutella xylostella TaxID=51655 RepID=UPI00203261DA|nr:uncharacterized protein LOC105381382 [Plutella xylostella]